MLIDRIDTLIPGGTERNDLCLFNSHSLWHDYFIHKVVGLCLVRGTFKIYPVTGSGREYMGWYFFILQKERGEDFFSAKK